LLASRGVSAYELDDDPARVDVDVLWSFLSTEAYWGRWRTREDVVRQLQGSWRVLGAYDGHAMVGYARAISNTSDPQIYERFGFVAPDATLLERPGTMG